MTLSEIRSKIDVSRMHPIDQLKYFRNKAYLTDDEEESLETTNDIFTFRFFAVLLEEFSENATFPGTEEYENATQNIADTFKNFLKDNNIVIFTQYGSIGYVGEFNDTFIDVNGVFQLSLRNSLSIQKSFDDYFLKNHIFGNWLVTGAKIKGQE